MGNILENIKRNRSGQGDEAMTGMMEWIYSKRDQDAETLQREMTAVKNKVMSSVRGEIEGLKTQLSLSQQVVIQTKADTTIANTDRDAAKTLQGVAEKALKASKERVTQLTAALKLEQGAGKEKIQGLKEQVKNLTAELSALKTESQALEIANVKLASRTEPKRKVVKKAVKADPKFVISNVTRDSLNNISGGEIKVVRAG